MKKILTSVLAASMMLLGTSAFAQVSVGAGYVNSTSVKNNSKTPGNGFYAGLEYTVPVSDFFGLSAGVNYDFVKTNNFSFGSASQPLKEQFINVPVRLNLGFNMADAARLFVFGGPTFSYAISGKESVERGSSKVDLLDIYKDWNYNRFDVMVGGGVGLDLMEKIRLTVGYDLGMFNKYPKGSDGSEPAGKYNRNRLHAGVAFLF